MAKVTLTDITSGYAVQSALNSNNTSLETELNDKVLYRDNPDGEANQMENQLDMNSNRIVNLPSPVNDNEPARKVDLTGLTTFTDTTLPAQSGNEGKYLGTDGSTQTWKDPYYIGYGHTPTRTGNTTFTIAGDVTAKYPVGTALRLTDSATIYGVVTTVAYTTLTTVTIASGDNLTASLSAVEVDPETVSNSPRQLTVLDYGADNTGATDASGALQAAVDNNRSLRVPAGTYKLSSTVNIIQRGQQFLGDGRLSTIFSIDAGVTGLYIGHGSSGDTSEETHEYDIGQFRTSGGAYGIAVAGIVGQATGTTPASRALLGTLHDVTTIGATTAGWRIIEPQGFSFINCNVRDNTGAGIIFDAVDQITPADADSICLSQTPAAGGAQNLTINGVLAVAGSVTHSFAMPVTITSDADDSGRSFTVTGTDAASDPLVEVVTGPNTTTVTTTGKFKTITQVQVDDDTTGAITVGNPYVAGADGTLDNAITANAFIRCRIYNNSSYGIHVKAGEANNFYACNIESNGDYGVFFQKSTGLATAGFHFFGGWFENNTTANVFADDANIVDLSFHGVNFNNVDTGTYHCDLTADNLMFLNCRFVTPNTNAVRVNGVNTRCIWLGNSGTILSVNNRSGLYEDSGALDSRSLELHNTLSVIGTSAADRDETVFDVQKGKVYLNGTSGSGVKVFHDQRSYNDGEELYQWSISASESGMSVVSLFMGSDTDTCGIKFNVAGVDSAYMWLDEENNIRWKATSLPTSSYDGSILGATPTATTAQLADITHTINTENAKVAGYMVFNTTTSKPVWAVGSTDGNVWVDATGATAHTPV